MPGRQPRRTAVPAKASGRGARPAVTIESPVVGALEVTPRYQLKSFLQPAVDVLFGSLPTDVLLSAVEVPVRHQSRRPRLHETTARDGWPRRIETTRPTSEYHVLCAPLVLSGGTAWHRAPEHLEIVGNAVLIDGAGRLLAAVAAETETVPCIVVFGLSADDELQWHLGLNEARYGSVPPDVEHARVGTTTERLTIDERPVRLTIESDPFVVPTALGYAPAILVRRDGAALGQHLLLGAKSLARPLEQARDDHGSLVGLKVRVRKLGRERSAEYEVVL